MGGQGRPPNKKRGLGSARVLSGGAHVLHAMGGRRWGCLSYRRSPLAMSGNLTPSPGNDCSPAAIWMKRADGGSPAERGGACVSRLRNVPLYSIGAVCRLTGLSERRIRYYEQAGLLHPARTAGNQRRYSQADVDRLLEIKGLLSQGLHVDQIRERLRHQPPARDDPWVRKLPLLREGGWPPATAHQGRWPLGWSGAPLPAAAIDRLFRGPAPSVPGVGVVRSLYPRLDPAVLYQARRGLERGRGAGGDEPAAG